MRRALALALLLSPASAGEPERIEPREAWLDASRYMISVTEILTFEAGLNVFDRTFLPGDDFDSDWNSFTRNLKGGWEVDTDPYPMNQLLHPYGGSIYYGCARSVGLGFWEGLALTFAGSALWELAGETTRPSVNDQITTTFAGTFFGEALFRMASLLLENQGPKPSAWRELAAALISPPTGVNRLAFGDTFDEVLDSREAPHFERVRVGGGFHTPVRGEDLSRPAQRGWATLDFAMDYGLPGRPGYRYERPFDYFRFEAGLASSTDAILESLSVRGLVIGTGYAREDRVHGAVGLFGMYDFFSPEIFRVSSTAAAIGTVLQWRLSKDVTLRGCALGGVGFGAGGSIAEVGERDYHYGVTPQALVALDLLFADVAMLEFEARDYFITGAGSDDFYGYENIARARIAATLRLWKCHALGLQYTWSRRDADYDELPDTQQTFGTISLHYTLLGDERFGAVRP